MGLVGLQLTAVVLSLVLFLQPSTGPAPSSAPASFVSQELREDMRRFQQEISLTGRRDPSTWTLAETAAWSVLTARSHLEMARKRYALTPEQETAVRGRLDQLLAENRVYWQEHLAEYRAVREEIDKLQGSWRDPVLRERRGVLQRRSSELKLGEPIHPTTALPKIEQMLPKAQVEAYNQKHRRPSSMPAEEMNREGIMRRMMFLREQMEKLPPALRGPGLEHLRVAEAVGFGSWERYVDAFIRVFDLDEAQQTTARSILRELQARRDEYQQTHRDEFQALRDAEDHKQRSDISAELTPPIRAMFDELKARLDRIPRPAQRETAAQRDIEQHKRSARMAAAASRPSQPLPVESAEPADPRP